MLKLLIVLPMLVIGMALLGASALVFLPLLALLPIVLAIGAVMFAFVFAHGNLRGCVPPGVRADRRRGSIGDRRHRSALLLAGGAAVFGFGLLFAHLLLPLLVVVGVVWLIRRAAKPPVARIIAHG